MNRAVVAESDGDIESACMKSNIGYFVESDVQYVVCVKLCTELPEMNYQ